jgi:hypothetical protein
VTCPVCGSEHKRRRFCSETCGATARKREQRVREAAMADPADALLSKLEHHCWKAAREARSEEGKLRAFLAAVEAARDPEAARQRLVAADPEAARELGLLFEEAA